AEIKKDAYAKGDREPRREPPCIGFRIKRCGETSAKRSEKIAGALAPVRRRLPAAERRNAPADARSPPRLRHRGPRSPRLRCYTREGRTLGASRHGRACPGHPRLLLL